MLNVISVVQDLNSCRRVHFLRQLLYHGHLSVHVEDPYSRIETTPALKKVRFILSKRFDFHIIDNLSIAVHASASRILMSFSVDEMLLPNEVNLSTNFREPSFSVKMSPF